MLCKCSPHLAQAYFTCKVAAHSPDDHLSPRDWKEVCPGITFLAPTRTSQMCWQQAAPSPLCAFLCSVQRPCKSGKQNFSSPPAFTTAHFHSGPNGHKEAEDGTAVDIWKTNLLTHCPHQRDVYLHTFLPPFLFIDIISTGKNNLVALQKCSHFGISASPKLPEFFPLMLLDLIGFDLYVICTHETP